MKKLILTLSLASLAVACRSTADVSDTSANAPGECSAEQAACCSAQADAATCEQGADAATCEDKAELKVCPVTGKVLEN